MKQLFIILTCLLSFCARSQSEVFTITEEAAEFPGGMQEMAKYLQKNLKYPDNAQKCHIGGKVFLKFIVETEGTISNVEVIKSSGAKSLDDAAIEVVKTMPMWKPARMSGRNVRCYFNLPVNFKPEGPYLIFNTINQNTYYSQARSVLLERAGVDEAISLLQKDVGDPDAWYALGVLNYNKGDKDAARRYFDNVKLNSDTNSKASEMCKLFLEKYF